MPATLQAALRSTLGIWNDNREKWNASTKIRRVLYQMAVGAKEGYLHAMTIADAGLRSKLFSGDLQHELAGYEPLDVFREIYNRAPGLDPLSKMFYLDLKTFLVDDILTKVDRASMANSLEVRVPLLDHKVVEFAFSLPIGLKLRKGRGKYLLRKAMQRHLPASHLNLSKKGFVTPGDWLRSELREWGREILFSNSRISEFLDLKAVEGIWKTFQEGGSDLVFVLNILINFSLSSNIWAGSSPVRHSWAASCPSAER
jgi:asparagine synthase (glutamine-hydrolysing)